ncbi:MAG: methylmalonyl-CoA mutase [Proteobacteria bacterium]|nr:methylmalonyl-CoA mutase [Pseudomonadota bacterium]
MDKEKLASLYRQWNEGLVEQALKKTPERPGCGQTPAGIPIKQIYTPLDLEEGGFDYVRDLGFPGQFPFTRGRDPLGYRSNYWLFMQYAGFGDAEEANKRYRYLLSQGQAGISVAFDLPTQVGLDSDDPMADGEVGKIGVAVSSLQDLETVFDGIPLNKLRQISLVANGMSAIMLAMFIALAEKQGVPVEECTLRIQNDVLKEFISRGAYIFPPEPSIRLTTDVVVFCAEHHPAWLPLTLCGYHIREAGANAAQEVAYCLANGLAYMDEVVRRGAPLERVLPQLSAFMAVNMNFFEEIAKFRALRRLWARLVTQRYGVSPDTNLGLSLVNFTAGSSLTAQQPLNNVVRVAVECLAGVLGGCQSLFPCSMDEAYATPTEAAVKVALRTQQIIAKETGIGDTVDPMGGSYYLESLTGEIERRALKMIEEIEALGGSVKAIDQGYFRRNIDEASYQWQKEVDSGARTIVGVNAYQDEVEVPMEIFRPPAETQARQIASLKKLRQERDNDRVEKALDRVRAVAATEENLVPALVEAVKAYATMGEICGVLRSVFGEHNEGDI